MSDIVEKKRKANERIKCVECGEEYTRTNKLSHFKSKLHIKIVQLNTTINELRIINKFLKEK